jgi:hypothetical protein
MGPLVFREGEGGGCSGIKLSTQLNVRTLWFSFQRTGAFGTGHVRIRKQLAPRKCILRPLININSNLVFLLLVLFTPGTGNRCFRSLGNTYLLYTQEKEGYGTNCSWRLN